MAMTLKPETETRIVDLARRLGFAGPDAVDQVLDKALDDLDAKTPQACRKMTPEEMKEEMAYWTEVGRRNRALHPYDDENPPSKIWQDELYDDQGLPK